MRVAVITSYFPSSAQPWQGRTAYQTLRLLAARCELKVFYMESRYPGVLTPRSRTFSGLDPSYRPEGLDVEYIPYTVLPLISRPLNGWTAARALLPRVRAWQPEILLSYILYPDGDAALRVAAQLRLPLVATAIGSDLNRISDPLCGVQTRRVLRDASAIMTVSSDLRRTALRLGADPDRTQAVLNGADGDIFRPRDRTEARHRLGLPLTKVAVLPYADVLDAHPNEHPTAEAPIILYVGRMDLAKGLRELIDAVAALRTRRPGVLAYLVGHGPDEPLLREVIRAHAAEDTIRILPACPPDEVAWWIAASNLLTLPSYREGCPNVIVEALACGRPVVASDVGGIPELLDSQSGAMVPAHDAVALERALDQTLGRSWDANLIHARHSRNWHDVAADVELLLRRALATRSAVKR